MEQMRKKMGVICFTCDKPFGKDESEVKRNKQLGRKCFRSRSCAGKQAIQNIAGYKERNAELLKKIRRGDEYSKFRDHLRRAKRRDFQCNLSLEHLKEVWEKQQGKCIYTGIQMIQPSYRKKNDATIVSSLDRIDSSRGCDIGNVQFVVAAINYMKGSMSREETKSFIEKLKSI